MPIPPLPEPLFIATDAALNGVVTRLEQCSYFAIDTEFVRTDTFYPDLGLIQLSDGRDCWLLDPLQPLDFSGLTGLLKNTGVTKVFHACSEDLEVLQYRLGCSPQDIFDSQVAAALAGYGFSRGYAGLIEEVLEVSLGKHETRSDWLRRPLNQSQMHYAAEDVYYLVFLFERLDEDLGRLQRREWLAEDMSRLLAAAAGTAPTKDYYRKVKGAWKLDRQALATLQHLCDWREREARTRNKPRRRVADDKSLLEIALAQPGSVRGIAAVTSLHPGQLRKFGESLCKLVAATQSLAPEQLPEPLPKPIPREAGAVLKQLRKLVADRAEQLDIPAELLARKADLEQALRAGMQRGVFPEQLQNGWREVEVGQPIRALLQDALPAVSL